MFFLLVSLDDKSNFFRQNLSQENNYYILILYFRYAYTLNKDAGVVTGLDGALQRIIINGNAIEDLIEVSKNSRGITKYVGPPCDDEKSQQHAKCMNGGVCTPFFRSYVCKCTKDYIGPKCEKSKRFVII